MLLQPVSDYAPTQYPEEDHNPGPRSEYSLRKPTHTFSLFRQLSLPPFFLEIVFDWSIVIIAPA